MSASTTLSTSADKLIDGLAVAKLAGRTDPYFAHTLQRRNPTFPRQMMGGPGKGKALWSKAAVEAWLVSHRNNPMAVENIPPRLRERTTSTLDNAMARQIICRGWQRGGKSIRERSNH
jgi:predicted DNA-binding transcriptional regulator AlpA